MVDPKKCPMRHKLPHHGSRGQCTPLYCADPQEEGPPKKAPPRRKQANVPVPSPVPVADAKEIKLATREAIQDTSEIVGGADEALAQESKNTEAGKLALAAGRWAARNNLVKVPKGLEGAEAEEYVGKRNAALLPHAHAEIEFQLKFGDDEQRLSAARDVLDIAGLRKKEGGNASFGGTIVLNLGSTQLPWQSAPKVVDGQIVTTKKEDT